MELHPLSDHEFVEKSVNKDTDSSSDIQIAVSQSCPNIAECTYVQVTIDNHKNDQHPASIVEEAKTGKDEEFKNVKTTSSEGIQNDLKEEILFEKTPEKVSELKEVLPEKSKQPTKRKRVFSLLDSFISVGVVGPLVIGFWRGIWTWMDLHAEMFPGWFSFTFGAVLHVVFAIFKHRFHDNYTSKWAKLNLLERLPYRALRILYTYTFGVACNAHWRGGWIIIDDYFLTHVWITTCLICLLLACLAVLRCVRNLIAPPFIIFIDIPAHVFQFPTRYNVHDELQNRMESSFPY